MTTKKELTDHFKQEFSYNKKLATKLVKTGYGKEVKIIDAETAKLSPKMAAELARTYLLFTSRKPIDEHLKNAKKNIKAYISEILKDKKVKSKEVGISIDEGDDYDSFYMTIDIENKDTGDSVTFEPESLFIRSVSEFGEDAPESWDWAFWLMDQDSPFYSDEFVDDYRMTEVSQAIEQFAQTLDGSSFEDEFIGKLVEINIL